MDLICAILSDGSAKCWGNNSYGALGIGHAPGGSLIPITVLGITDAVAMAAGCNHTCALLSSGTIKCWGHNEYGQLGNGTNAVWTIAPKTVSNISNAVAIAANGNRT